MDRSGKPKQVVRVNRERLKEDAVREELDCHLLRSFSDTPVEGEDIEHEWSVFKASIADAVAASCGFRVVGSSRGGNPRTAWWTPEVREAFPLKKEAFRVLLTIPEVS